MQKELSILWYLSESVPWPPPNSGPWLSMMWDGLSQTQELLICVGWDGTFFVAYKDSMSSMACRSWGEEMSLSANIGVPQNALQVYVQYRFTEKQAVKQRRENGCLFYLVPAWCLRVWLLTIHVLCKLWIHTSLIPKPRPALSLAVQKVVNVSYSHATNCAYVSGEVNPTYSALFLFEQPNHV